MAPPIRFSFIPEGAVEAFFEEQIKPEYASACRNSLKLFKGFIEKSPEWSSSPNQEAIRAWVDHMAESYSPSTVNRKLRDIRRLFRWLDRQGLYPPITYGVKEIPETYEKQRKPLTVKQARDLLNAVSKGESLVELRQCALINLMLRCALHLHEIRRMKVRDVVFMGGEAVAKVRGKGKSDREAITVIPEPAWAAVKRYLDARGPLLPDAPLIARTRCVVGQGVGDHMKDTGLGYIVDDALRKAGIEGGRGKYSLQFTSLRLALHGGASVREVQDLALQSSLSRLWALKLEDDMRRGTASEKLERALNSSIIPERYAAVTAAELRRVLEHLDADERLFVAVDETGGIVFA